MNAATTMNSTDAQRIPVLRSCAVLASCTVAKAVALIPNAHVSTDLQAVNISGPPGCSCEVAEADGWRIYPPGSTSSVYVEQEGLEACANSDANWRSVSVVKPVS